MKRAGELIAEPDIEVTKEDISILLTDNGGVDLTFPPRELEGRRPTQVMDSESLAADLTNALALLGRVQDMFLMFPHKSMKTLLSHADFDSMNELDVDVCAFLEDFESYEEE